MGVRSIVCYYKSRNSVHLSKLSGIKCYNNFVWSTGRFARFLNRVKPRFISNKTNAWKTLNFLPKLSYELNMSVSRHSNITQSPTATAYTLSMEIA